MTQLAATLATSELRVENDRLRAELRASRARLVNAVHAERKRLERDLHDGAQGRLVSLAMSLGLLEAKLSSDPDGARPIARAARAAVAAALEELRELSQGIYPTVLTERGLGPALAELCEARRCRRHSSSRLIGGCPRRSRQPAISSPARR